MLEYKLGSNGSQAHGKLDSKFFQPLSRPGSTLKSSTQAPRSSTSNSEYLAFSLVPSSYGENSSTAVQENCSATNNFKSIKLTE